MGAKGVFTKDNLLTQNEIDVLKKTELNFREKLIVFGLMYTGMRVGEFLHMKKNWIDWEKATIHIPPQQECQCYECAKIKKPTKRNPYKQNNIWYPKTKAAIRVIPLMPKIFPVYDILKDYFSRHESIMETIKNRGEAWYLVNSAKRKAKIKHKLFPHAFRGTYATQLASAGLDAFHITAALGWEDIDIASAYIKLSGEQLKQAFEEKLKSF